MLSPEGYDIAWTQYQGYVVDKLNRLTAGTDMDFKTSCPVVLDLICSSRYLG